MNRIIFTVLLSLVAFSLTAQRSKTLQGTVSGIVKDSADKAALPSVTVTVYNKQDSSIVAYLISGNDGSFRFSDLPLNATLQVSFTFTGYNPLTREVRLDSTLKSFNLRDISLSRSAEVLEGVVVKAAVPVSMNGDTLEINPAAFKLDSNAVAEDILRQVPGIILWGDGSITVNGKKVTNVFVDGKQFFGSDPAIATQNLPKHAIDKIQVYQQEDFDNDDIDINPEDSLLTMNIRLKDDKRKGYFGKAGAGYGTDKRHEADLSVMGFKNKLRGGLAASSNNINKAANLQDIFRMNTFRTYNPSNQYVANFNSTGINKIRFLGGNAEYDFSDDNTGRFINQLEANYSFNGTNNITSSETNAQNSATDVVFLNNSSRSSVSDNKSHSAILNYNKRAWDKDLNISSSLNSFSNNGNSASTSSQALEDGKEISNSTSQTISNGSGNTYLLRARLRNKDDDDRNLKSFNLNYNLAYSENQNTKTTISDLSSISDPEQDKAYNRLTNSTGSDFQTGLDINYNALKRLLFGNFNLWDINLVLRNNLTYTHNSTNSRVGDFDPLKEVYLTNDSLTNINQNTVLRESPSLRLSRNFSRRMSGRFNRFLNVSATIQGTFTSENNKSSFDYRNLKRDYSFFAPIIAADYSYRKIGKYAIRANVSGNQSSVVPSINQLYPIIDTSTNLYSINLGGTGLRNSQSRTLNSTLNYRRDRSNQKLDYNFSLGSTYSNTNDAVTDSSFYDKSTGRKTTYLINMDGRKSFRAILGSGVSIKMKNNRQLQFTYSGTYSNMTSPNYIDGVLTKTNTAGVSNRLSVFYSLSDIGNVQLSQSISTNTSRQTAGRIKTLKTTNNITQANININITRDLTFSNTLNSVKNNTISQTSTLWNAFVNYRFLKSKQAEVKFSVMDILGQNKNIATTADMNNVSTTVINGLQHFMMVTVSYYPRQFGGGSGRNRGGNGFQQRGGRGNFRPGF